MIVVKIIQKIICIIICIVIIMACGGDPVGYIFSAPQTDESTTLSEDPVDIYFAAAERTNLLNSFDLSMNIDIAAKNAGSDMTITISGNMKVKNCNSDSVQMYMNSEAEIPNVGNLVQVMYYDDGYLYKKISIAGQEQKGRFSMSSADIDDLLQSEGLNYTDVPIRQENIKSAVSSNNNKTITLVLDGQALMDSQMGMLSGFGNTTGGQVDLTNYEISDIDMVINLNDEGYIASQELGCSITDKASGLSFKISANIVYNRIDQAITIDFPDFSGYEDMGTYSDLKDKIG